jgi:hypothetical protein
VAFADYAIWGDRIFYYFGDPRPGMGRVAKTERRLRFEPDTAHLRRRRARLHIDLRASCGACTTNASAIRPAYMRCGMYGGTATRASIQAPYVGDDVVEGDRPRRHRSVGPRAHLAASTNIIVE